MVFPEVMYGCESWTVKKAERWIIAAFELCFWRKESWTLGDLGLWTLERLLDCKEIQPVHLNGNQSWIFIGRMDVEAETPILWLPDVKNWLIGKDPNADKDWRWEEKVMREDEMVGWHHQVNGHEFEWTLGAGDGQGGLACCSLWLSNCTELNGCWQFDLWLLCLF